MVQNVLQLLIYKKLDGMESKQLFFKLWKFFANLQKIFLKMNILSQIFLWKHF